MAAPAAALDAPPAAPRPAHAVAWTATADYARILHLSPSFEEVWGRPRASPLEGQAAVFLASLHPEDRAGVEAALAEARRRGDGFEAEYRIVRPDGAVRRIHDRALVVRGDAGEPDRVVGVALDVTDDRCTQEGLEATRRELARLERLSTLGSLVSGLAHEVRTPLAAATNHLSLVNARLHREAREGRLPPGLEDAAGHVAATLDALDRINGLVNRLRRFAAPTEGTMARHRLHEVVEEAVRIFEAAHKGHVQVDARLERTERALMDKVRIEEVVLRVLENAAEASVTGATIVVATRDTPLATEVVVSDHGPGIPPEAQALMFQEFYTTKPDRAGLGLSIARRIVEAHGGTITCRSDPGKGATFVVSLPRR
ncbi:MAG TPA: ATP-binding protein [Candidatus Thermoplasmatota archaeon]|nr:ATP-binding protein [Candidatus Thermoplasmatota archaeon]